jgi:hypothetical protein
LEVAKKNVRRRLIKEKEGKYSTFRWLVVIIFGGYVKTLKKHSKKRERELCWLFRFLFKIKKQNK